MQRNTAPRRDRRSRTPRALHLVDVENLALDPDPSVRDVEVALAAYGAVVPRGPGDLTVLSASTRLTKRLVFRLDIQGRFIPAGSGRDAADLALLQAAPAPWVADRFDRLVIASGDGIFSSLSEAVHQFGCEVWVASWRRSLSRELATAADQVRLLDAAYGMAA